MYEYEKKAIIREHESEEFWSAVDVAKTMMEPDEIHEMWMMSLDKLDMIQLNEAIDMANKQVKSLMQLAKIQLDSYRN